MVLQPYNHNASVAHEIFVDFVLPNKQSLHVHRHASMELSDVSLT